jgi:hypothetical protein
MEGHVKRPKATAAEGRSAANLPLIHEGKSADGATHLWPRESLFRQASADTNRNVGAQARRAAYSTAGQRGHLDAGEGGRGHIRALSDRGTRIGATRLRGCRRRGTTASDAGCFPVIVCVLDVARWGTIGLGRVRDKKSPPFN